MLPARHHESLWHQASSEHQKYVPPPPSRPLSIFCEEYQYSNIGNADKGPYMFLDRLRWARLFSVPMNESLPPGFPKSSLPVQRALCAIAIAKPERLQDCIAALCKASWVEQVDIYEETALRGILVKLLGESEASGMLEKVSNLSPPSTA